MYQLTAQHPQKRAFITGAGSGLGKELCLELAKDGWTLGICDISEKGLHDTAAAITAAGGRPLPFILNVADRSRYGEVAAKFLEQAGGIDLLVNNAGVGDAAVFEEYGLDNWEWLVGINQMGVIYGCHYFIPAMKEQRSGHIINVSSIASIAVAPYMSAYNATKAAVKALSETLYAELQQFNIRVSVMMPFFFRTNITQHARGDRGSGELSYYMVHGSKVSASKVAQEALKLAGKRKFYILLPSPARSLFRMQRLSPMGLLKMNAKFAKNPDMWLARAKKEYEKRKQEGVV